MTAVKLSAYHPGEQESQEEKPGAIGCVVAEGIQRRSFDRVRCANFDQDENRRTGAENWG
jgi:hypothetical protein